MILVFYADKSICVAETEEKTNGYDKNESTGEANLKEDSDLLERLLSSAKFVSFILKQERIWL